MIQLISFIGGRTEILVHLNSMLAKCNISGVKADCSANTAGEDVLAKFLLQAPADLVYIIAHSSEENGIEINGKILSAGKLAAVFPRNKKLLPKTLFLNTCYGKQHYLEELSKLGIENMILTDNYILTEDALRFGEAFIKELLESNEDISAALAHVNNKFTEVPEFFLFANNYF